jgi:hypothetical protein
LTTGADFNTVAEMCDLIRSGHKKHSVEVKTLWSQRNIRDWVLPHVERIQQIKSYRYFKFTKAGVG